MSQPEAAKTLVWACKASNWSAVKLPKSISPLLDSFVEAPSAATLMPSNHDETLTAVALVDTT
eukprot:CAMPEP_0177322716 /NCGR_PEP_ID=MMETSP0368-20130122/16359_1 /TAXON_ID=447022 ORGANISM="Scrippsiella hangoei-like, Strain SHHI-4" /NCGR_SAMPLE_ID=MMETSP0368 /ASSEMBLY_ACC=CAM_ASM_000363 /LENGTH=62 /DNA_ID=CAMNT_0018782437 /DNA_START=60 /DNA_END=248 /DNA_ORIENTATION=-